MRRKHALDVIGDVASRLEEVGHVCPDDTDLQVLRWNRQTA